MEKFTDYSNLYTGVYAVRFCRLITGDRRGFFYSIEVS